MNMVFDDGNAAMITILLSLASYLIPIILIVIGFLIIFRLISRIERRADERVEIEMQQIEMQQKQLNEISELKSKIDKIDNLLKEID